MINISIPNKSKIIKFVPRFNKFIGNHKVIPFNMYRDFNFNSIANVISMKFITQLKTLIKFVTKIKINTVKLKNVKTNNAFLKQSAGIVEISKFNPDIAGKLILNIILPCKITPILNTVSSLGIKLSTSLKHQIIELKVKAHELFYLFTSSKIHTCISSFSSMLSILYATVTSEKTNIKGNVETKFKLFSQSKKNNINQQNVSEPTIYFNSKLYVSQINFKSVSTCVVYRPKKLSDLYPDKLENWYDKSIEEIFYGEIIQ